jgi:hypothetical protein
MKGRNIGGITCKRISALVHTIQSYIGSYNCTPPHIIHRQNFATLQLKREGGGEGENGGRKFEREKVREEGKRDKMETRISALVRTIQYNTNTVKVHMNAPT